MSLPLFYIFYLIAYKALVLYGDKVPDMKLDIGQEIIFEGISFTGGGNIFCWGDFLILFLKLVA